MNNIVTSGRQLIDDRLYRFDKNILSIKYLTIEDFDEALQNIEAGGGTQITLPSFSTYSEEKKADGNINCNNKRVINILSPNATSIEEITQYSTDAINVETSQQLINLNLLDQTAYCGPALSTMDVKLKRITNLADSLTILSTDNAQIVADKGTQAINLYTMQQYCLGKDFTDNYTNYQARNNQIRGILVDPLTSQEMSDFYNNIFTQGLLNKITQSLNLKYMLENAINLRQRDPADTSIFTSFDAGSKNIQNIRNGVRNGDAVNLSQLNTIDAKFINYVVKNANIDLGGTYKITNSAPPTASSDLITKVYFENNIPQSTSGGSYVGGLLTSLAGSFIGGVLSSAILSTINAGSEGLVGIGNVLGNVGTGLMVGSLMIGNGGSFSAIQEEGSNDKKLFDGLKQDIGKGDGYDKNYTLDGGAMLRGALSVSGLVRAPLNSQYGLFEIVQAPIQ